MKNLYLLTQMFVNNNYDDVKISDFVHNKVLTDA